MNFVRFLEDLSIPHRVLSRGWVELKCVFCSDQSMNLGFNIEKEYVSCWRCGGHRLLDTVMKLANSGLAEAEGIIRRYSSTLSADPVTAVRVGSKKKPFKYPVSSDLLPNHRKYLESRGYNPDELVEKWKIRGTGPVALLDDTDYKHRIIIPITWGKRVVSFQSRDITGKHNIRYLACPKNRELVPHQTIVYCDENNYTPDDWMICVEGVFDVWRLGPRAFATFGTSITREQVRNISATFRKVVVLFDREPEARVAATKLIGELRFRGVECQLGTLPLGAKDPAVLSTKEAERLITQLLYPIHSVKILTNRI